MRGITVTPRSMPKVEHKSANGRWRMRALPLLLVLISLSGCVERREWRASDRPWTGPKADPPPPRVRTGVTIAAIPEMAAEIYMRRTLDGRRLAVTRLTKTTPHFWEQPPPGEYEVALVKGETISDWHAFRVGSYSDRFAVTIPIGTRALTQEIRDTLNGIVRIGMTREQLRDSWGDPARKNTTVSRHGRSETWSYGDGGTVFLDDGKVTGWTRDE
jgi:hypothetical protein